MTMIVSAASELSRGPHLVTIECNLTFDGPLHVGTGERLSVFTDAPLLRDGSDNPVLPGSSIRGVLRDWCEREAALLDVDRGALFRLFGRADFSKRRKA
jgi:CRISPR/Cas system CMR subunit Cmr4 (Cas7 group RAMP superfamily)